MKKSTEYTRRWRQRNPIRNLYQRIKHNAKDRGISFSLTWNYFHKWCLETRYHEIVGRGANDATIDRKDHTRGYENGNIQILTNRNNVLKHYEAQRCKPWYSLEEQTPYVTENPF